MKDKIESEIYNKLCEGFNCVFFTFNQFEIEYEKYYLSITTEVINLFQNYNNLKTSKNKEESSQVVKIFIDDFIIQSFNEDCKYDFGHVDYTLKSLNWLKLNKVYEYDRYVKSYDTYFNDNHPSVVKSFNAFIKEKKSAILAETEINELSFEKLFWNYFVKNFRVYNYNINAIEKNINNFFIDFRKVYLDNDILKIYEKAINQIKDIEITNYDSFVVNVGRRNYREGNSGWIINNFEVYNNKKEYEFSNSTKDESRLNGIFINLFLLQLNKKHLLKISVTLKETEQTPFIIWKDFEKISLKNDCEIFISKHHGNESIIFDSKIEAIKFQEKVIEIKEGRNNYKK